MSKTLSKERQEAIEKLRSWLKPGDTVFTILRSTSRSGISREIGVVILKDGTDLHPNYLISQVIGWPQGKRDSIKVSGCGMDVGFHLVYQLSHILFPDGFKVEGRGRNGDTSGWDTDGGYALKQRWL